MAPAAGVARRALIALVLACASSSLAVPAHANTVDAQRISSLDLATHRLGSYQLMVPVAGVISRDLRDTYGELRGGQLHEALDIHAPRGTPVVAVGDGRVVKLFKSVQGGLTVYQFDPSEQFAYYYAHLDRYQDGLAEGMVLKRGDPIGFVGTTGNAPPDAPHLHFAIFRLGPEKQWWKGSPINPYPLLN